MKKISTTYIAAIVSIIVFVLPLFGLDVADEGTITNVITNVVGTISSLYIFYGRYKAKGITAFGIKKKDNQ